MDKELNDRKVGKAFRCRHDFQTGSALSQTPNQRMTKIKQTGREASHSISSRPEVKDVCSVTSTPIYTFKVRYLPKHDGKFSLQISLTVMEKDKLMSVQFVLKARLPT